MKETHVCFPSTFSSTETISWGPRLGFFCVHMLWCVLQLTSNRSRDLIPADAYAVLDLTDKSGVDIVIHLQYSQLVAWDLHCVWYVSRHAARTWAFWEKDKQKEMRIVICLTMGTMSIWTDVHLQKCVVLCIHQIALILIGSAKPISFSLSQKRNSLSHSGRKYNWEWRKIKSARYRPKISSLPF